MGKENAVATERRRATRHKIAIGIFGLGILVSCFTAVLWSDAGLDRRMLTTMAIFAAAALLAGLGGLFAYRPDMAEQTRTETGSYRDRIQRKWVSGITILPAATFGLTVIAMTRADEWLSGEDPSLSGVLLAGAAVINLLLIPLMLMGWDGGSRKIKRLLEDELTKAYRASAITCAFWVLLVGTMSLYLIGLWRPHVTVVALPMVLWIAAATAALRFAQMHRRAEREMGADD